jgi:hypothetical protein
MTKILQIYGRERVKGIGAKMLWFDLEAFLQAYESVYFHKGATVWFSLI